MHVNPLLAFKLLENALICDSVLTVAMALFPYMFFVLDLYVFVQPTCPHCLTMELMVPVLEIFWSVLDWLCRAACLSWPWMDGFETSHHHELHSSIFPLHSFWLPGYFLALFIQQFCWILCICLLRREGLGDWFTTFLFTHADAIVSFFVAQAIHSLGAQLPFWFAIAFCKVVIPLLVLLGVSSRSI